MSSYNWRKNFIATVFNCEHSIKGKLAFKTKETNWINTDSSVIIPLSIHTNFHEGLDGELKVNAFISTIKDHVKGKITIILADQAHLGVLSLKYQNCITAALRKCTEDAHLLLNRLKTYFEYCNVVYWQSYIGQDENYKYFYSVVKNLSLTDTVFQELLKKDAESTYTDARAQEFPDKEQFMLKAHEDLLEQCVCLLVIANKGYRFQFYPGASFASTEYVNEILLHSDKKITQVKVFLTIEKKIMQLKEC